MCTVLRVCVRFFFFQAEDGIRDIGVTGVQTCALPIFGRLNPEAPHNVVLVLDATTGQNALSQIEVFREVAGVTGLVMTKLDGTARGGVLVAAAERYKLPIHAIGVGEGMDDLRPFDARQTARAIAGLGRE